MNEISFQPSVPDKTVEALARERQNQLTKPPGSLGRLEEVAIRLAAMQRSTSPAADRIWITVFAADHGVVAQGVAAFPQSVTQEMIKNFAQGGAAISVLAGSLGCRLQVVDLGTVNPDLQVPGVEHLRLGLGSADFSCGPAMDERQLSESMAAGYRAVDQAIAEDYQLFIGGEMGIGNTTPATAIASVLLDLDPLDLAGPGTGLDQRGVIHKADVIKRAVRFHGGASVLKAEPLELLRCLGGFEIAALCGAYLRSAERGLPVLVDGLITASAALLAERLVPGCRDWFIAGHKSAEPAHRYLLAALALDPLLDLGMRLGEGSGAASAIALLRLSCELHNRMSTFAEAGVATRIDS